MSITILPQLMISAAALLTVTGSLSVFDRTDGALATLFAESEDVEEEEREDPYVRVSEPNVETTFHVSTRSVTPAFIDVPIMSGPHNERGPPLV